MFPRWGNPRKRFRDRGAFVFTSPAMFLRLVTDSFTRRPRRKLITLAALALGMAVVTAALSVSLNIGDKLAEEFRSLGANLVVTPLADSLPLEIGGVDYRPANAGAFLAEADLGKLKMIFWRHNIRGFAPILEAQVKATPLAMDNFPDTRGWPAIPVIGTWVNHEVKIPDGSTYTTGVEKTNPWWQLKEGRWFVEGKNECVVGKNFAKKNGLPEPQTSPGAPLKRTSLLPGNQLFTDTLSGKPGPVLDIVGVLDTGGPEDDAIIVPIEVVQNLTEEHGMYRRLYVSAQYDRWYCSPYISSIALQIGEVLKGTDVRVIRRVAEGEGNVLRRVRTLLWLVTVAALLAAVLAVGASAAASVIERRSEIGLMKALGAGSGLVGVLLAAEQLLVAIIGGAIGYAVGIVLARMLGERVFGFTPEPKFFVLLIVLVLAAAVTLLGSAIPLRRASRYEPAPILRGE
jgi:putative ABC transport system permease protein